MRVLVAIATLSSLAQGGTTLDLNSVRPGARTGVVTVSSSTEGLLITGRVGGGAPDFATAPAAMASKDHVEIWLAAADDPVLPAIGWGNQFGMMTCQTKELSDEQRKQCQSFARQMVAYRARFRRLFVRQYQLAPGVAEETFASPAYAEIVSKYTKRDTAPLASVKPSGAPAFSAKADGAGYTFEARIPWTALPPVNSLRIGKLRVMVDVFSATAGPAAAQPYSTTSKNRKYGEPTTFNNVSLDQAKVSRITACQYELKARDIYADELPAWYLPNGTGNIRTTFIIQNTARGYQYEPGGLSPVVEPHDSFEKEVAPGKAVCGPYLAYVESGKIQRAQFEVDGKTLDTRTLPDGSLLIKSGPTESLNSPFGSGQCGSCTMYSFSMYRASAAGFGEAFDATEVLENGSGSPTQMRVDMAPDWSKITVYRKFDDVKARWDAESHCLAGGKYQACGKRKGVPAPK